MSRPNNGMGPESDLLSVALGESGLDQALTDLGKGESSGSNPDLTGATLSLESTSTPNDLLNWAFLLSNTNAQNLAAAQDSISSYLEPFNEFIPASDHPKTISKDLHTHLNLFLSQENLPALPNLFLNQEDFTALPHSADKTNSHLDATLKDLLSANDFSSNFDKNVVNGTNVNIKDPRRKYVMKVKCFEKFVW